MEARELLPTETAVTRGAWEVATRFSSPALANHCAHAELLYVAPILHDLGLTPAFDNHREPFEDAGGHAGWVFAAGAGWPEARRRRVHEIVVRHMWDAVDPATDPEGHLLCLATGFDISGTGAGGWPPAFQAKVLEMYPRLDLAEEFLACFTDQADRKPSTAAAAGVRSGIAERIATNPLDGP